MITAGIVVLLTLVGAIVGLAYRNGDLLQENAGLKRLIEPREQVALGPYRAPSQTVCRLNETHPDDCREQIQELRARLAASEAEKAGTNSAGPFERPAPTSLPGPGRLVRG